MSLKQKIIDLNQRRPDLTATQIAQALIVHPGYVRRIGIDCGLIFARAAQAEESAA